MQGGEGLNVPEGGQRSKNRKSPCATMPLFRSPLSRMLLSPKVQLPEVRLRSPRMSGIDLNVEPEEVIFEATPNAAPDVTQDSSSQSPRYKIRSALLVLC